MATVDARKKQVVSDIIRRLHAGLPVEEARNAILRDVGKLSSAEITDIEQSLIDEGVSPEEIKTFCNVHALLFESALAESIAAPDSPSHPVNMLRRDNREIERIVAGLQEAARRGDAAAVQGHLARLRGVDRHYALKENAIFPFLERHGFPGPSKVMWSKHNEVRELLKKASATPEPKALDALLSEVQGMIFKEENILFPAALERITASEWMEVLKACDEIGYPFVENTGLHAALVETERLQEQATAMGGGEIVLPTGRLALGELRAIFDTLPVDITFVDAEDRVKYFSQSRERIFMRAKSVLGRKVQDCHPPQSVQKVVQIIDAFRSGTRDHADFWIQRAGKLIHIRYFAVRDQQRAYLGTLEVTQDLTEIRSLSGERRLLDGGA